MRKEDTDFIHSHLNDNVDDLVLHASRFPGVDIKYAATQISGWQKANSKLPLWAQTPGIEFPRKLSMEQCSSEKSAEYKASVVRRLLEPKDRGTLSITDLTGGFGVDATMICRGLGDCRLTFVERDAELCRLANINLPLLGIESSKVICSECQDVLETLPLQDLIFVDPARRDSSGRKTVLLSDCTPDLTQMSDHLLKTGDIVMAKLSPMLDITQARRELNSICEIHVVGVDNECKEVLLVMSQNYSRNVEPTIVCANILPHSTDIFSFTYSDEEITESNYAMSIQGYLFEPNATIMKAGAFKSVGARLGLQKLHPSSHLYTSKTEKADFPGRRFIVTESMEFNKQGINRLSKLTCKANITVRNFPLKADELRKRLKLSEGGSDYLFATTLADNTNHLILCKKV